MEYFQSNTKSMEQLLFQILNAVSFIKNINTLIKIYPYKLIHKLKNRDSTYMKVNTYFQDMYILCTIFACNHLRKAHYKSQS